MYKKKYQEWLDAPYIDDETKEELRALQGNEDEIEDRFYQNLAFGTAGLRGIIGAGTNRMNRYTVSEATQGLATAIVEEGEEAMKRGVVIGYDVRHKSDEFARITAEVLAGNGIHVYLYDQITPTPLLSFSVLRLQTIAGVMITASHNPRDYNGYKAYWEEGSQILDNIAERIGAGIRQIKDYGAIKTLPLQEAKGHGLITMVGRDLVDEYLHEVESRKVTDDIDKNVSIVYSPLNGTGNVFVQEILKRRGFANVHIVKEQELPDPDFTSVGYPNPEDPKAFALAETIGKEYDADILIATDPDADRIAMEVKDKNGDYVFLNGNQIGALLVHHILSNLQAQNRLPEQAVMAKSIVTGDLSTKIAADYGVAMRESLTGFKHLYAIANEIERAGGEQEFLFAYEESIGYSYGTYVRDKDAVMSAMLIAEMAGDAKKQGKTPLDTLYALYEKYGYHKEKLISLVKEGSDGQQLIARIMDDFRQTPIDTLNGAKLEKVYDFTKDDYGIGHSNVLKYHYEDGSWYAVRPSGTEPKIKFYMYSCGKNEKEATETLRRMEEDILAKYQDVK